LAEEFDLWWTPQKLQQPGLGQSSVTLSQRFFEQLVEAPVPLDLRAIKALKRSPSSLDLYAWATRRVSYLKRLLRISWASFQLSFGAGYAETPQGRCRFRGNAIEALRRVKVVYPQLKIEIQRDGILLYPSLTHVPKGTPLAVIRLCPFPAGWRSSAFRTFAFHQESQPISTPSARYYRLSIGIFI
jgi:hypothetical protein